MAGKVAERSQAIKRTHMTEPTTLLAEFVSTLELHAIPSAAVDLAGQHTLDTLAGLCAGLDVPEALCVCRLAPRTAAGWAGNVAMLSHAAESDPIHGATTICAGAIAIPAVLGTAREISIDGATAISAIIAGYETAIRIGAALGSSRLLAQGWWPTAVCGGAGAAAAAARAKGLSPQETRDAIALALVQAGGLGTGGAEAPEARNLLLANTVRMGFEAAEAAEAGIRGPAEPLIGERGFLYAFGLDPAPDLLLDGLGERWTIGQTSLKAYPCALQAQTALDALGTIIRDHELRREAIEAIEIALPAAMRRIVDRPDPPRSRFAAAASMPFLAAALVCDGDILPVRMALEGRADQEIIDFMPRVNVVHAPELDAEFPAVWPAAVTVLHGGQAYQASADTPLGHPERPIGLARTRARFDTYSSGTARQLQELILGLPGLADIAPICDAIDELMPG
jgi:2-methylcitrate dehydratase PrpD